MSDPLGDMASDTLRDIKRLGGEGVLTESDMPVLSSGHARVRALMSDEQWHTADEIRAVAGGSEGLRRLRELRAEGMQFDKRRTEASRNYEYRLVCVAPKHHSTAKRKPRSPSSAQPRQPNLFNL